MPGLKNRQRNSGNICQRVMYADTLTRFSNALGTKVADKTVRNIRGRIKAVQSFYLTCLEKDAIPEGFREALQFGMYRMGLTPGRLIRLVGQTAYKWARGDSSPDPRHKDRCGTNMKRLEEQFLLVNTQMKAPADGPEV